MSIAIVAARRSELASHLPLRKDHGLVISKDAQANASEPIRVAIVDDDRATRKVWAY